jgi:hypothetical protein
MCRNLIVCREKEIARSVRISASQAGIDDRKPSVNLSITHKLSAL